MAEPVWEPSEGQLADLRKKVPECAAKWTVLRSRGGVWHRILFRRDGASLRYISTSVAFELSAAPAQMASRCYWCGAPSSSKEHVPPQGLYYDVKGTSGITVPSCVIHNQNLHVIDEAFLALIAILASSDLLPRNRYADAAASRATDAINSNSAVQASSILEIGLDVPGLGPLGARLNREIFDVGAEKIGRGLYQHHFRTFWPAERVWVDAPLIFPPDSPERLAWRDAWDDILDRESPPWHAPKDHRELFAYQGLVAGEAVIWRMRFFETVNVHVSNVGQRAVDLSKTANRLGFEGPIGEKWHPVD